MNKFDEEKQMEPKSNIMTSTKLFVIVGAHRTAEQHRPGMLRQGLGQRIAEARAADIEGEAAAFQDVADPPRRRMLLVQDDEDARGAAVRSMCGGIGQGDLEKPSGNARAA